MKNIFKDMAATLIKYIKMDDETYKAHKNAINSAVLFGVGIEEINHKLYRELIIYEMVNGQLYFSNRLENYEMSK